MKVKKVVLAYSGGLDTSVIIPWLKDTYHCEVIAYCANIGQGLELEGLEEKAISTGASKIIIEDLTQPFIEDYIWPTLQANAIYEGKYLLGTSFARPLIAKRQVEIALAEGADAVAHGATGKGNDQVRFELTYMALAPQLTIVAPWKDPLWTIRSREDAIDYAQQKKIPISVSKTKIYSEDRNIWHISHEGGALEDPWKEPDSSFLSMTTPIAQTPDAAEYVMISFKSGIPVAVNGIQQTPINLLTQLNIMGGKHGIGHIDLVENRLVGIKSRGVYETPGGTLLYAAHQALESLVLDRETSHYKQQVALKYADLVYNGQWFCPLREALDAFVKTTQKYVTGDVRIKLYKGNVIMAGVKSPYSMYKEDLGGFGPDAIYDQKDAVGFIKLFGLPFKVRALTQL